MKYYVTTTEQVKSGEAWGEYMTKSDPLDTEKQARSDYFDKLSAINKDLSENGHAYALIELRNSKGVIEKYELGTYVEG